MTKSIETKQPLINLALAVADALEDPTTPSPLMDGLREVGAGLVDHLSGESIAPQLRVLAGLAQSGHIATRAEGETPILDSQDAILPRSEQESEALAMTN